MEEAIRMHCERCGQQMRQAIRMPLLNEVWVQDWFAVPGQPTRRVSELDEDMCESCEKDFLEACKEAGV